MQACQAKHVADFVRIANCRRDAVRKHAAVELPGSNQRALAMYVAIDKAGDGKTPFGVDLLEAAIAVESTDNHLPANGDVARLNLTGDEVQDAGVTDDKVSGQPAQGLIDLSLQNLSHESITPPEAQSPGHRRALVWFPYYRVNLFRSGAGSGMSLSAQDTMDVFPSCPIPTRPAFGGPGHPSSLSSSLS